jgi:hypothetical protein
MDDFLLISVSVFGLQYSKGIRSAPQLRHDPKCDKKASKRGPRIERKPKHATTIDTVNSIDEDSP